MQRPDVRIIDNQKEEVNDINASQSEIDYLLSKYGYAQNNNIQSPIENPQTFEDMLKQQELEKNQQELNRINKLNAPNPISFSSNRVGYSETKWSDVDVDGSTLGIKIQIVTDMKI